MMMTETRSDAQNQQAREISEIIDGFDAARAQRAHWEPLWRDAYDFTLPQRSDIGFSSQIGALRTDKIYDATAMDAVEQLAASLLGNLTPTWSQWFGLKPGPDMSDEDADALSPVLEKAGRIIQDHFDRSNFAVEIHQCYLDLVVGGTASITFQEAEPGAFSAFHFTATPLSQVIVDEGESGYLDTTYRVSKRTLVQLNARFPDVDLPADVVKKGVAEPKRTFDMLECVRPNGLMYAYTAILMNEQNDPSLLETGSFETAPFINFRWLKSPGEIYGRSPVIKALPDIKTANKVVELTLKNASIAVAGIWQADDDGVINPANIELKPGTIIPKAVGSRGLQPLDMPGRFDVSQLVLDSLQSRIRHALLTDKLGPIAGASMTATEVLERSAEMSLLLGATYGRLQTELLTPLIKRAFTILRRRGEIPDIALDGRLVMIDYRSPLARSQGQRNVQNTLGWINAVSGMGPEATATIDAPEAAKYIGESLAVPSHLMRKNTMNVDDVLPALADVAEQLADTSTQPPITIN